MKVVSVPIVERDHDGAAGSAAGRQRARQISNRERSTMPPNDLEMLGEMRRGDGQLPGIRPRRGDAMVHEHEPRRREPGSYPRQSSPWSGATQKPHGRAPPPRPASARRPGLRPDSQAAMTTACTAAGTLARGTNPIVATILRAAWISPGRNSSRTLQLSCGGSSTVRHDSLTAIRRLFQSEPAGHRRSERSARPPGVAAPDAASAARSLRRRVLRTERASTAPRPRPGDYLGCRAREIASAMLR